MASRRFNQTPLPSKFGRQCAFFVCLGTEYERRHVQSTSLRKGKRYHEILHYNTRATDSDCCVGIRPVGKFDGSRGTTDLCQSPRRYTKWSSHRTCLSWILPRKCGHSRQSSRCHFSSENSNFPGKRISSASTIQPERHDPR